MAADAHKARRLTRRDNHDGTSTISIVVTTADANACENAINAETDAIIADAVSPEMTAREVIAERHGIAAVRADAFVSLLTSPDPDTDAGRVAARVEVLVDLDQITAADDADAESADRSVCEIGGSRIAPEVARRLGCDTQIASIIQDRLGDPLSVGREARVVPRRIRRALNLRGRNRCQFLGCSSTRGLHAHHIVHWANGGPTELSNLVLVCNFHHHLLHEHAWNIEIDPSGGHRWITPSGETATIKVSRGRHTDLDRGDPANPNLIYKLSGETLKDLAWITTALIHNETNNKTRRTT
ncbi:MAG: HNH endonuclease [Acidimicrobiales bacterium]